MLLRLLHNGVEHQLDGTGVVAVVGPKVHAKPAQNAILWLVEFVHFGDEVLHIRADEDILLLRVLREVVAEGVGRFLLEEGNDVGRVRRPFLRVVLAEKLHHLVKIKDDVLAQEHLSLGFEHGLRVVSREGLFRYDIEALTDPFAQVDPYLFERLVAHQRNSFDRLAKRKDQFAVPELACLSCECRHRR